MTSLPIYREPPRLPLETTEPQGLNPTCTGCPLHEKVRTVCMAAEGLPGKTSGTVLIIGRAPEDVEDRQGRPFIGSSGVYLRDIVGRYYTGEVILDNAIRCMPGAREIKDSHIETCRSYLAATYAEAKPDRVIALGGDAIKAVMGRSFPTFSTRRGYTYLYDRQIPVFFVLHPRDGALRNRFIRQWFEEDMEWALTAPAPQMPPYASSVRMITTPEESEEACFELETAPFVTFDCETFGRLYDREYRLLTLGISSGDTDDSYIWEEEALQDPAVRAPLARLLANPRVKKGGQNVKFDCQASEAAGMPVKGVTFDTRLWRKMLQADALTALETMQPLVGMGGGKDEVEEWRARARKEWNKLVKKPATLPDLLKHVPVDLRIKVCERIAAGVSVKAYDMIGVPAAIRAAYCGTDVVSTKRLKAEFEPQVYAEPGVAQVWDKIGAKLSHAITRMETNGIMVSIPAVRQLQAAMQKEIDENWTTIEMYGIENPGSAKEVGKVLFEDLKLPITKATAKGQPSVDAETLENLKHPLATAILKHRKATKFKSQYADGMEMFVQDDGRVHPSIKIDGTESGRPSCENPNIFNIPRPKSAAGKMCRDIFVADELEDMVLLEGDYSQIEICVAAGLSGDQKMIQVIRSGADFHLETAKKIAPIFGFKPEDITKEHWLRDGAKTTNFAVLYGKDEYGLGAELGIGKVKAKQLIDGIFGEYRDLAKWIKEQLAFARKHGYCRTWWDGQFGRIRPLWRIADANDDDRATAERSSWNTPIQGTATEFTNASLGAIQEWIEQERLEQDAKLVLTVYDSIILEVRRSVLNHVARNQKRIMEQWASPSNVPIKSELKFGPAWGSLDKYDPDLQPTVRAA